MTDPTPAPPVRFRPIDRQEAVEARLDELLPPDHPARLVVEFVVDLDFSELHDAIQAREGRPGSPAYRPEMLFALWLFATSEGVASSRRLEALCRRDLAYRWICGGPAPSYHTLSDFYSGHAEFLNRTFVSVLASLTNAGLLTMKTITIDGRKIPADAGKGGFHREPTLQRHLDEAEERVAAMERERAEGGAGSGRRDAAHRRAVRERKARLEAALAEVKKRQAERAASHSKSAKPEEARASETDADSRKMKRSHGGYEPCYNVQTATDEGAGFVVAVEVTAQASDNGLLGRMVEAAEANTGATPERVLADAGYSSHEEVKTLENRKVEVLMPPKNERKELAEGKDPYAKKCGDSQEVEAWRARMGTAEAREQYGRRAPVAEGVHARQSNRGWKRFRLRGLAKARAEALWQAIVHNLCIRMADVRRGVGPLRPRMA